MAPTTQIKPPQNLAKWYGDRLLWDKVSKKPMQIADCY
jgi:hypothetical protein